MAEPTGENKQVNSDDSKYQDENFLKKLKLLAEQVGMTVEEAIERKISKNQLKKMVKTESFKTFIEEKRKRAREKQKLKIKELAASNPDQLRTQPEFTTMEKSANKVKIVIDLGFDKVMNEKELQKTFKQVKRCYSYNRRSKEPCQFYLTSINGKVREYADAKNFHLDNWDVNVVSENWYEYFKSTNELSKVVFLSPDSETSLPAEETMVSKRDEHIFIIGGLCDHNFHKNMTLKLANEKSVPTAKLPIDEHLKLSTSRVLSINQVFEIVLNVSTGSSWKDSLLQSIPQRKRVIEETDPPASDQPDSDQPSQKIVKKSEENDENES